MPTPSQIGTHTFEVVAVDARGATSEPHVWTVTVSANRPPTVEGNPPTTAVEATTYFYPIRATDPDGDPLTFRVINGQQHGVQVDPDGLVHWDVPAGYAGQAMPVTLGVSDGLVELSMSYTVQVTGVSVNQAPVILSMAPTRGVAGNEYRYQVVAQDPNPGDTLRYELRGTGVPGGMTIDPASGLLTWNPAAAGTHTFWVAAVDRPAGQGGLAGLEQVVLVARANTAPQVLPPAPPTSVTAGTQFLHDVRVSDAENDAVSFSLTGPNGMTINQFGVVSWTRTSVALGTYNWSVTVTDEYGSRTTVPYTLQVTADTVAPVVVEIEVQDEPGRINVLNRFRVDAQDNVAVVSRTLEVSADNGQTWTAIELDSSFVGRWTPTAVGVYQLRATATDAAGLSDTLIRDLNVIDPAATGAPVVTLTAPGANAEVTAPTAVTGAITDNGTLLSWKLDYRPLDGSTDWKVIKQVTSGLGSSVNVSEVFDPTILPNGLYELRLTGTDTGGNVGSASRTVEVDGNLKLGNFTLSFTDLTVPVAGIPITIGRIYDTLDANKKLDFGYGWRLTLGGYEVSVDQSTTASPFLNSYPTFKLGTRVYVQRPDGGIDGYTFTPEPAQVLFGNVLSWYPAFTPDATAHNALEVDQIPLTKFGDEFIDYEFGGYNPANPAFGGAYDVTDVSKLKYEIDGGSGEQISVRDRNDNKLTLEYDGVVSATGRQVRFERDAEGRITAIEDPRGNKVRYRYNTKGDLVEVTDRLSNPPTRFTYRTDRPHYLDEVIDPLGRTGIKTDYNSEGRLKEVTDAQGKKAELAIDVATRTQTITDQNQNDVTVKYDPRGNVTEQVNQEGVTTRATYKPGTAFPESETQVVGAPGGDDDLTTIFTSDAQGRLLTQTDPQGRMTQTTYNDLGFPETIIDPFGITTTLRYDTKGNMELYATSGAPAYGFTYFSNGTLKTTTGHDATKSFEYNVYGDQTATVNPSGVRADAEFDANGNKTAVRETFTVNGVTVVVSDTTTYDAADRPIGTARIVTENGVPRTLWSTTKHYNALGQVDRETDQNGNLIEYTYDTRGMVIETRQRVKDETGTDVWLTKRTVYNATGRTSYTTDPFIAGSARPVTGTRTEYDDAGRVTRTEMVEGLTINVVGTGNNLSSEIASAGTVLHFTTTEYDSTGQQIRTVDKYGRETQTTYDRFGRKTQTRTESANANGSTAWLIARTVYDARGRESVVTAPYMEGSPDPVYATRTIYDEFGRKVRAERLQDTVVALDPATGNTTLTSAGTVIATSRAVLDDTGRTELTVSATGEVARYEYDSFGRGSAVISHAVLEGSTWVSQRTETEYDMHGRQRVVRTNVRAVWSADPNSAESTATYTVDSSQARETTSDYDVFGNQTKTTFEDGNFVSATYDDFNRRTALTDELGQTANYEFDSYGRITAVVQAAVTNPATGLSEAPRTEYRYDAYGNHARIEDANDRVTTFGFDAHNRQSSRVLPAVTGEPTAVESMAYNAFGDLDFTIDFKGQKADYVYDYELTGDTRLGLLRRLDYFAAGASTPGETVTYTYDAFGRTDVVTETAGGETRVTDTDYDGEGRVTRIQNADGEIRYAYNLLGQRTQMWTGSATALSGGRTGAEYGYDAFGRLNLVREVRRAGTTLTDPVETRYTFNFAGELAIETVTQGTVSIRHTAYQYHAARGWVMNVTHRASAGGALLSDFAYTRRADGLIATVTETVKQPDGSFVDTLSSFVYDANNRLKQEVVNTSAAGEDYTTDYTLDLVGNRVKKVTAKEGGAIERTEATLDARDRLMEERVYNTASGGTPVDTVTYQYDRNGSRTLRQTSSGSKLEQNWDLRNRLAGATASQLESGLWEVRTTAEYKYTGDGIRSRVTENGTTTRYTIDPLSPNGYAQVVEELTSNLLAASYVYGAGLDPLSTYRGGSGAGVYLVDAHSGVRQVVAAGAAVLAAYLYDVFGITLANAGTFVNPIGYRGERFDLTLGQYYLRARFYDPATGRFTKMDPFAGVLGHPLTQHRYIYASGDALNQLDPTGRFSVVSVGAAGAIGGALAGAYIGAVAGFQRGGLEQAVFAGIVGGLVGAVLGGIIGTSFAYATRYLGRGSLVVREFFAPPGAGSHFRSATVPFITGFILGTVMGTFWPEIGFFGAILAANWALEAVLFVDILRPQWSGPMLTQNPNLYNYWNEVVGTERGTGRDITRRNWARGIGTAVFGFCFGYIVGYLTGLTVRTVVQEVEARLPLI